MTWRNCWPPLVPLRVLFPPNAFENTKPESASHRQRASTKGGAEGGGQHEPPRGFPRWSAPCGSCTRVAVRNA